VWVGWVYDYRVVLDINQTVGTTSAARLPCTPVEVPDVASIANSPEADVNGVARWIGPINGDIRNQAVEREHAANSVIDTREGPRTIGKISAEYPSVRRTNEHTDIIGEDH